jgi:hypothetical protein
MYRVAAVALLVTAACFTSQNKNATLPTGVIGPTGGGTTGGGGGNGAQWKGTYHLQDVNDSTLPVRLANDSVSGVGSIGDTTRVFQASIDSAILVLNSDSSAEERDYLTIRDARSATDSSFNRQISFGDTLFGTFRPTATTVAVSLTDTVGGGQTATSTYQASGTTLTGTVAFALYNTDDQLAAAGNALYNFGLTGAPAHQVVGQDAARPPSMGSARRSSGVPMIIDAAAASNVRRFRVPAWALRAWIAAHARTRP